MSEELAVGVKCEEEWYRRQNAVRKACANISTEALEQGVVQKMADALGLAISALHRSSRRCEHLHHEINEIHSPLEPCRAQREVEHAAEAVIVALKLLRGTNKQEAKP